MRTYHQAPARRQRLVLIADQVLTLDAAGRTFTPGAVVIEGNSIRAVGPLPAEPSAA